MDWQTFAVFIAAWTGTSIPFGMLVGGAMGAMARLDDDLNADAGFGRIALLPPPAAMLPSARAVTREIESVRA